MTEVAKSSESRRSGPWAAVDFAVPLHEGVAKFRIGEIMRRWCTQSLGDQLSALILTGSLARNEATWLRTSQGLTFLSDAEFIALLKTRNDVPSADLVTLICSGAEEELRNQGVVCKLSMGAVDESFLLNLGDTIFGHELVSCGEVLHGDHDILQRRMQAGAPQVSEEDAWRLLANRTVELLEIAPEMADGRESLSEAAQYRLTKLFCDMATSLLVFKREFVPGYQSRSEKLASLSARDLLLDLPLDVAWFVDMVQRCTDYKILHSWDGPSPFAAPGSVQQAVAALRSLWSWELAQMEGIAVAPPESLLRRHMQGQGLKERLRGWAFAARRRGVLDTMRHSLRWLRLLRSASPRYCVYAAALETVSSIEFLRREPAAVGVAEEAPKTANARKWLPLPTPPEQPGRDQTVAEAVLWNYQEFLVETRA